MHIYTIYKATNTLTGKCYIGFDSNWPVRKSGHLSSKENTYFHSTIKKYGKDAFIWEIIYQSYDRNHCLKEMEPYFIKENDSYQNGYNMTIGGEGAIGKVVSEETKSKMRIIMSGNKNRIGKNHSEETKKKMAKIHRNIYHPRNTVGRFVTY